MNVSANLPVTSSPSSSPEIAWDAIDTVLLDMDGTLLDLNYDNHVWNHLVPQAYAERHNLSETVARELLLAHMREIRGTMEFYSFNYWSSYCGIDLIALHQSATDLIRLRPGCETFLAWLQEQGKTAIIATNADRLSVQIKHSQISLERQVDALVSSHDYGCPKEDPLFWDTLQTLYPYDPARTIFVDDNEPVLEAAEKAGIAGLLCVETPDSAQPKRPELRYPSFDHFDEIYAP